MRYTPFILSASMAILHAGAMAQDNQEPSGERIERMIIERDNMTEENLVPTDQTEIPEASNSQPFIEADHIVKKTVERKPLDATQLDTPATSEDQSALIAQSAVVTQNPVIVETVPTVAPSNAPARQDAERGYISDEFYVPVRSLPSIEGRVVHNGLKSGTPLAILNRQNDWARIRTDLDQEGWVKARFVSKTPISKTLLIEQQQSYKTLNTRFTKVQAVTEELRNELKKRATDLAKITRERQVLSAQMEALSGIGGNPNMLNDQIQSLIKKNHLLTQETDVLKARLSDFDSDEFYRSFLYGAFAVFLGAVLSVLIPTLRGRKRLAGWQ